MAEEWKDERNNFIGGLNWSVNPDAIAPTELLIAENVRITSPGAITLRTGTKRMHPNAIGGGAAVRGVYQWDAPAGKQVVAVSNGKFYHKTSAFGDFTEVTPGAGDEFSTTEPTYFEPFRASGSGAALILYMASGGKTYKWDGTTLTRIDGTNGVPGADFLASYHTRMFYHSPSFKKHLFWSKIGDAETCTFTALPSDGGSGMVDVLTGEAIVQMKRVGTSLAFMTDDSVGRYTGYSDVDVTISDDTEGIDPITGVVSGNAVAQAGTALALLSDNGAWILTESSVERIDYKSLSGGFNPLPDVGNFFVAEHRGRNELWFGYGDGSSTTIIYVFNKLYQSWSQFPMGMSVLSLARYEDSNGKELLMGACSDGFVRLMDNQSGPMKDDALSTDTTGSTGNTFTGRVTFAPYLSQPNVRALRHLYLLLNKSSSSSMTFQNQRDDEAVAQTVALITAAKTNETTRVDVDNSLAQFNKMRINVTITAGALDHASPPSIRGVTCIGDEYARRW